MWLLITREPTPDAAYWPGRCGLAAVDAVVWPLLWVVLVHQAPPPTGVVGPVVTAMAVWCAVGRLRRAVWANHRYRFTTWRWGRIAFALLLMGEVMKWSLRV